MGPDLVAKQLSRNVPRNARLRYEGEDAFGDALTLRRWKLGNGLRILTVVDDSAPVIAYQTWFRVGSRHEVAGKTGLAHFFEHLMFNATSNFPQGEFDRRLEAAGAENNAATWTDWTFYHETLPAKELPLVAELESDRMANLVLHEPQVASEREVVASERRDRIDDDVEGKASEVLYAKALGGHPYRWPTLGWMRDIQSYTPADCVAFYRRYYAPNNATLVLAGHLDEAIALGIVQERYGALRSSRIPEEAEAKFPAQRRERRHELALPAVSEKLCLGQRGPAVADADWRALAVLGDILLGGRSSRLYRELVDESEVATEVSGSLAPFALPGLYEVWVGMREGVPAEVALERVDAAFARVCNELVPEAELEKAKSRAELDLLASLETVGGKAEQIGFDDLVLGDPAAAFTRLDQYRALTPADLQRVARRYLTPAGRTSILVRPR